MIKNLRNRFKNNDQQTVLANMFSLFILQATNYILPLILLPYLVRVLGVEYFGLLAFATATVSFFRGVVSYGFDLTGTQQISIHRDNNKKLIELFSAIMVVKLILAFASLLVFTVLLVFVNKFQIQWEVFLFTFLIVFGDVLFPVWFFQGIEKMKIITYIRLSYKSLFVLSVILFVQDENKYILVPLLDSIGAVFAGLVAIYFISKNYGVTFVIPSTTHIIFQFKNGWHVFISNIAVYLYSSINTFLLGLLTNNISVGYYAIAEKIYMAIRGLFSPVTQALFPFLAKKYEENRVNYYKKIKKLSNIYFLILHFFAFFSYIFSQELIQLVSGEIIPESVKVLKILSLAIVFAIGGFYTSLLIIKGEGKTLSKITFICMIVNLVLVYPSIYLFDIYGLAALFLFVQLLQALLQLKYNKEIFIRGTT